MHVQIMPFLGAASMELDYFPFLPFDAGEICRDMRSIQYDNLLYVHKQLVDISELYLLKPGSLSDEPVFKNSYRDLRLIFATIPINYFKK